MNALVKNVCQVIVVSNGLKCAWHLRKREFYRDFCRESSVGSDTVQPKFSNDALRSARESLPSVDSAVDSWGELGEGSGTVPEILRLWDTASVDSGQLDLSMPSYPG